MRKNSLQLPSKEELEKILSTESKRIISADKKFAHYPNFSSIINLFNELEISSDYLKKDISLEEMNDVFIEEVADKIEQATKKILENNSIDFIERYNAIYDYLSEEDILQKSDFIFIFGSKLTLRADKAIELYNNGFSKKIIVSGGNPIYENNNIAEAENLKNYIISKGISAEDIITENKSISIPDNVKSALNLLEEKQIDYSSFIIINSPFAQRRGWCHFQKFTPPNTKIYRTNANSLKINRVDWHKKEESIKSILNEFIKMKIGVILNTA